MKHLIAILTFSLSITIAANSQTQLNSLIDSGVMLDSLDRAWLSDNDLYLGDMVSMVKADTTAMNRAIVQMTIKIFSNGFDRMTDEEVKQKNELLTEVIHGTFDDHGLSEEKALSAYSWFNIFKTQVGIE